MLDNALQHATETFLHTQGPPGAGCPQTLYRWGGYFLPV